MKSIRQRMAWASGSSAAVLLLAGGLGIFLTLRETLTAQFDTTLTTKAQALISASEVDDGELDLDFDIQSFAGFGTKWPGDYFEVRTPKNRPLARSPSLASNHLPPPPRAIAGSSVFADLKLPDGRRGRAVWLEFSPKDAPSGPLSSLQIVVASDITELQRTIHLIALVLTIFGASGLVLTLALLHIVLGAGLRPLGKMTSDVQRIDLDGPERRFVTTGLPSELRPVAEKLNDLLGRLEATFARERRFSSNAAHELRTPLAELKVMTELGVRWPEEFTPKHGQEMLHVISELEALLDKLSLLARADSATVVQREAVDLPQSIAEALERQRAEIEARALKVETRVEPGSFSTDPILWRAIVGNTIGNAASYAPAGSSVEITASQSDFQVRNAAPDLTAEDVGRIFERFWRKAAIRAPEKHSGLGLSVVKASAELLGGTCTAELQDGVLSISIHWN